MPSARRSRRFPLWRSWLGIRPRRRGAWLIEVESASFPPQELAISAIESNVTTTPRLGLAHRGQNAPPILIHTLNAMARRLADYGIEDLRRAI